MQRSTETRRLVGLGVRTTLCALVCAPLLLGACNIVGPAGFLLGGEEKIEALYQLPAEKPVVVFVDDRGSVLPSRAVRERISKNAEQTLLEGGAAAKSDIISSEAITAILSGERSTRQSGIAEIGASVGAGIVVYATVDAFGLSPDGSQFAPTSTLRVKVMDVKTRARVWPPSPQEWHTLTVQMPVDTRSMPTKQTDRSQAEQDLAARTGVLLGRLFVKHVRHEQSPRIGS